MRIIWWVSSVKKTIMAVLLTGAYLFAQEGHPLKGTWHGSWVAPGAKEGTNVTVVMDWDGDNVTGILNPGLRSSPLSKAALEPAGWKVHFESDMKERSGGTVHVVVDAHIEEVTNIHRRLVGTWSQGNQKGDFKAVRDN